MNPLFIGISRETELNEKKKLIFVNMMSIICVSINLFFFVFLFFEERFLFSTFNLAFAFISGFFGFYFMQTRKYKIAKVFNLIAIPLLFVIFCFIYGDLGFNFYFILLSILSFFILHNKMC